LGHHHHVAVGEVVLACVDGGHDQPGEVVTGSDLADAFDGEDLESLRHLRYLLRDAQS
jgi:hypothetical protein